MMDMTNRYLALELAIRATDWEDKGSGANILTVAAGFYDFLEPAQCDTPSAAPTCVVAAAKQRKSKKAVEAAQEMPEEPAAEPVIESVFTIEDIRAKLVQVQTKTGTRAKSMEIIGKFSGPGKAKVLGSLELADYGKIIAACDEALAA